jgi:hypothetical protein
MRWKQFHIGLHSQAQLSGCLVDLLDQEDGALDYTDPGTCLLCAGDATKRLTWQRSNGRRLLAGGRVLKTAQRNKLTCH